MNIPGHDYLRMILNGEHQNVVLLHARVLTPTAEDDRWAGYARFLASDPLGARDLLGRAISGGCVVARVELATVYRHLGETSLARETLDRLPENGLTPFDHALAGRESGMLYLAGGALELAVQTLEPVWTSVQTAPTALRSSTALALGWAYSLLGKDDRAAQVMSAALADPRGYRRAGVLVISALCQIYAGRYVEAGRQLAEARAALPSLPNLAPALAYTTAVLYRAQGRYSEAIREFNLACGLAGEDGELVFFSNLGACAVHTALGQLDEAACSLAKAARNRTEPRRAAFWEWRAAALGEARGQDQSLRLERVRDQFVANGWLREAGWASLHLAESCCRRDDVAGTSSALNAAADIRHTLGTGTALILELRDLPQIRQSLEQPEERYAQILLRDLQVTKNAAVSNLFLTTLGKACLYADGKPVALRLRRSVEILAYLLHKGQVGREQLLTDLWPETAPKEAGNYFHQVKHTVEAVLPGLTIPYDRGAKTYSVLLQGPSLCWDVDDVKSLLSAGTDDGIQAAVQTYTGAFLPGASASWTQEVRRELEWSLVKSGLQLIERWNTEGQTGKCLELSRRLREIEPYNEALAEYLVVATLELEGHLAASRTLQTIFEQFQRELGEVPETLDALKRRLQQAA